ncbi:MAG: TerB family tellurite resistance protein, partial [Deltaproteobacteria bacterium]|nr:TerB family tellurite resistance protein [Deltaproteobacteria bacterium]
KSNVSTKSNFNFRTIPCRSCGAPLGSGAEDKCEYCGAVINDGSRDWVLYSVDIFRPYSFQTQFTGVVKSNDVNKLMLSAMISAMLSDKTIDEKEREMVYNAAQNRGIPKNIVDQMIESAKKGELLANPSNIEEVRGMLSSMARVALSDGRISQEEYNLLLNFGAKYNYKKADIDVIINTQRKLLFQEARDFIRNTRLK